MCATTSVVKKLNFFPTPPLTHPRWLPNPDEVGIGAEEANERRETQARYVCLSTVALMLTPEEIKALAYTGRIIDEIRNYMILENINANKLILVTPNKGRLYTKLSDVTKLDLPAFDAYRKLHYPYAAPEEGWETTLVENCPNLTRLETSILNEPAFEDGFAPQFDDAFLKILSKCRKLTTILNLSYLPQGAVTWEGFQPVLDNCPLTSLKLNVQWITDATLDVITTKCRNTLEEFDIGNSASYVTDKGMSYLARCHKLRDLGLGVSMDITPIGLRTVLQNCNIKSIDFGSPRSPEFIEELRLSSRINKVTLTFKSMEEVTAVISIPTVQNIHTPRLPEGTSLRPLMVSPPPSSSPPLPSPPPAAPTPQPTPRSSPLTISTGTPRGLPPLPPSRPGPIAIPTPTASSSSSTGTPQSARRRISMSLDSMPQRDENAVRLLNTLPGVSVQLKKDDSFT